MDHTAADDRDQTMTESEVLHALVKVRGREMARRLVANEAAAVDPSIDFSLATCDVDGCTVVRLEGELDVNSAGSARAALSERIAGGGRVVVDLRGCGFVDSMGLGALIAAHRRGEGRQLPIVVSSAQTSIRRLFEITNLDRIFGLFATVDDAIASLSALA